MLPTGHHTHTCSGEQKGRSWKQRKEAGIYPATVLNALLAPEQWIVASFSCSPHSEEDKVSLVVRRGWTGEPRTRTGKQVKDLDVVQGQAKTDLEGKWYQEGTKTVLPCGQWQARSHGARKEEAKPGFIPTADCVVPAEYITEAAGSAALDLTLPCGLLGFGMQRWL